jgi:hypothetical protein
LPTRAESHFQENAYDHSIPNLDLLGQPPRRAHAGDGRERPTRWQLGRSGRIERRRRWRRQPRSELERRGVPRFLVPVPREQQPVAFVIVSEREIVRAVAALGVRAALEPDLVGSALRRWIAQLRLHAFCAGTVEFAALRFAGRHGTRRAAHGRHRAPDLQHADLARRRDGRRGSFVRPRRRVAGTPLVGGRRLDGFAA